MKADEQLYEVWKQLDFNIDPINLESEKRKFFKNHDYNPIFEYYSNQNLNQIKKNLQSINPDSTVIGNLIKERRDTMLTKVEMLSNRKADNFTKGSVELFGKPDMNLLNTAYGEINLKDEFEIKNLSHKDARRIVIGAIKENGLARWKVHIRDDMSATAKVDTAERIVYIKDKEKFSTAGIERLIVHELQSHAFRMENSIKQKYKIFQVGLPHYLETEEGLAAFNEEKVDYLFHNRVRRLYAGRVIAIHFTLKKGFADVFTELSKHFNEEDAWNLTIRAKRGLIDTSQPGGFTKDQVYLSGKIKVKNFLKKRKYEGFSSLYTARIALKHVELLNTHLKNTIVSPQFLTKFDGVNI